MDGLFTDPNCSSSVAWSSWLGVLGSGGLPIPRNAEVKTVEAKAIILALHTCAAILALYYAPLRAEYHQKRLSTTNIQR